MNFEEFYEKVVNKEIEYLISGHWYTIQTGNITMSTFIDLFHEGKWREAKSWTDVVCAADLIQVVCDGKHIEEKDRDGKWKRSQLKSTDNLSKADRFKTGQYRYR
jgi:hypothetical protein